MFSATLEHLLMRRRPVQSDDKIFEKEFVHVLFTRQLVFLWGSLLHCLRCPDSRRAVSVFTPLSDCLF